MLIPENRESPQKVGVVYPVYHCRICGSDRLRPILTLGEMAMTGIFPRDVREAVTVGPLELVKCEEDGSGSTCGLLQLAHNFDRDEMYGLNYGYRSGLNASMVRHLQGVVAEIQRRMTLLPKDLIVDIGSNDGTMLSMFPDTLDRVGIDPTGIKFARFYPPNVQLIPNFFTAALFKKEFGERKARVITSIAMFYDLPAPLAFMREIRACLADDGLWVIEMSYMPLMLERLAYDTICHEHLEYYGLRQLQWMAQRAGFKILEVVCNDANGGSFRLFLTPQENQTASCTDSVGLLLAREQTTGMVGSDPYQRFADRVQHHREELRELIVQVAQGGNVVLGYGASTKGNVLIQYCGLTRQEIPAIADVNEDKYGCFTPGSHIPIISEPEAKAMNPDYFLVLPWHFRDFIIQREALFLRKGGKLMMPLPHAEIISNV